MAGFDNEVVYATNVDFSSGSPVSGKVTTNGQLLIGSTVTPNIKVGIPTGSTGVVVTTGSGTLDFGTPTAVQGPNSAVDGDIAVFNTTTGKLIRDGLVSISSANFPSSTGSITSLNSASTGLFVQLTNSSASSTAAAYFIATAGANADAIVNLVVPSKGTFQFGSKNSDSNAYITSGSGTSNAIGGTTLMKFESAVQRTTTSGGRVITRTATATDLVMTNAQYYIGVTSTASARAITLPAIAGLVTGQIFMIKDESGGAALNNITITPADAVNINGSSNYVINANYGSVGIIFNGTQFYTF